MLPPMMRCKTPHQLLRATPVTTAVTVHFGGSVLKLDSREHSVLTRTRSIHEKEHSVL